MSTAVDSANQPVQDKPETIAPADENGSANATASETKTKKKDKPKKKSKRSSRKNAPKTKVVIRRLPPNLPEEIFMNAVKEWTGDDCVDFKFYVPGKLSTSKGKEHVFSRAYFHMKSVEAVIALHRGFDGHIFLDSRGTESRAVVEFAPFQKLPKEHKAVDARQGTIDDDPDYLNFLEQLKNEANKESEPKDTGDGITQIERLENRLAMVTAQKLAAEQANKPKTTPLLEHIRAQKAAQAAAKAKAQAQRAAAKAAAKAAATKAASAAKSAKSTNQKEGEEKKSSRRERSRKKKEEKKAAANENNGSTSTANTKETDKADKPEAESPQPKKPSKPKNKNKEGKTSSKSGSKPKRIQQEGKQQIVAILGRQDSNKKDDTKTKHADSTVRSG